MLRRQAAALLVAALCFAVGPMLGMAGGRGGAQYSGTVVILSMADMSPRSNLGGLSNCEYGVNKLSAYYTTAIQIITTVYWQGGPTTVNSFCIKSNNGNCQGITPQVLATWQAALTKCYRYAAAKGFKEISILHHVDKADTYSWRALLDMDPLKKYGGYSYDDVALAPSWRAAVASIKPGERLWWNLAGEMGYTTFHYPLSWQNLLNKYKAAKGPVRLVGTNLNYQKVCNCVNTPAQGSFNYAATFVDYAPKQIAAGKFNMAAIKALLYALDFLAISNYLPLPDGGNFTYADFDRTFKWTRQELSYFGFDLYAYNKNRPLVIAETGLGGGSNDGVTASLDVKFIASTPYLNTWYPCTTSSDPWRTPATQALRRKIYGDLSSGVFGWLRTKGTNPSLRIDWVYTFPIGSYDFMGVQPDSSGYNDVVIANNLKAHNRAVQGMTPTTG